MKIFKLNILIPWGLLVGLCLTILSMGTSGCSDNKMARTYGGTANVDLPSGDRLVNITWKEEELWILTTKDSSRSPRTYNFQEDSQFGILEGTVVITEK